MKEILQESKDQLLKPLSETGRQYLIVVNVIYVILVLFFLSSEKIATGRFVPHFGLYFVYIPAVLINLISAAYNFGVLLSSKQPAGARLQILYFRQSKRLDTLTRLGSVAMIMFMCFCNIIGFGNPSNDALLTDFALAHILIVTAVILVGRTASVIWCVIVIAVLIYNLNQLGWDYQYHYLTPTEVKNYEAGLKNKETWALLRKQELEANRLNPPKATRYFNIWLVFILVSFLTAWSFGGVTIKILKMVPYIISNIEKAIQSSLRIEFELEQKQKEATKSTMQIVRYSEVIENLNKEIDKLEYNDKKKLAGVIQVIRQALDNAEAWEAFALNFDSIYNNFFKTLQEKYPDLTQSEMKHLAYLKMNLSHSEIARLLNVKMESLRTLRHRLKKKLGIAEGAELKDFVDGLTPLN
jgi:hypothetical protein